MIIKSVSLLLSAFALAACSQSDGPEVKSDATSTLDGADYVVMADDLQQLRDDFNANRGKVRLLFLNGPTCGICLRGMADLNDALVADRQGDERLVTFVVHVPTMGATEQHAADSIPLLDGPRVHHYWEASGIIGQHYREVMDVGMYVWDFWAIYGPDGAWEQTLPPVPAYYEHQLGVTSGSFRAFPRERVLDAGRFAEEAGNYLAGVDDGGVDDGTPGRSEAERYADGTVIPHVGQPRNVAVRQHIIGRGGYRNLKRIRAIDASGRIEANGESRTLTIRMERPNDLRRVVGSGANRSVATLGSNGELQVDGAPDRGLPADLEQKLFDTFEFDGLLVEWPDKGYEVSMAGMRKFDDVLAWRLELEQADGARWHLFLDSHTGSIVQANLLNDAGDTAYAIRQSGFRETAGFVFARRIEYFDGDRRPLAVETIDTIELDVVPYDMEQDTVAH